MRSLTTKGIICLQDDYNFVYRIALIEYTEWEDEQFKYSIKPFYNVIDMLPDYLFQGIPGIDISLRRAVYERKNILPTFISERSPGENREDVWRLLEENGMKALNRLEWLIKTNKRYSGDRFFVQGYSEPRNISVPSMFDLAKRSDAVIGELLRIICYGDYLHTDEIEINDKTRIDYYDLLMPLYIHNYNLRRIVQQKGIDLAKEKRSFKGRERLKIDMLLFDKLARDYLNGRISSAEASNRLKISKATFLRRIAQYMNK